VYLDVPMSVPAVVKRAVALAPYTTLQIGGPAEYFATVTTTEELQLVVAWAKEEELPIRILGGGSNILVPDVGVAGLVIQPLLTEVAIEETATEVYYRCGSGVVFDECVKATVARGWWGLENLSAIPGFVGATPIQNVGAYGVEVADVIESVTVFDTVTNTVITYAAVDCAFRYRHSRFKEGAGQTDIVLSVTFRLEKAPRPRLAYKDLRTLADESVLTPQVIREAVIAIRAAKFPDWQVEGTAGSFFKNPIITDAAARTLQAQYPELPVYPAGTGLTKVSLGYILDKVCGLRGFARGGVRLYEKQALVVVVAPGTHATAVDEFVEEIKMRVHTATNIMIEREVVSW